VKKTTLVVLGILAAWTAPAGAQGLFAEAPAAAFLDAAPRLGVVRSRPVRVRLDRIPGTSPRDAARRVLPRPGHRLVLNLFDDVVVRARLTRAEKLGRALVWAGKIEGEAVGDVVLTVLDGVLTGSAVWPGGAYRIGFDGTMEFVEQIDGDQFPENGCFEEVKGGAADATEGPVANAEDGSIIDVLVVYTPAARAAAGGATGIQALIATAVAETNVGYLNSGVVQRLRLAGAQEIAYTEFGNTLYDISTDLGRVAGTSDGYMDSVHALRDAVKADVVALLVSGYNNPSGACGVAYLMAGNNPGFAPNAFSVVEKDCATGYFSFGHEIGHNMGLNHARVDPVGTGAFPYSYGYKWGTSPNAYRTVMAYAPGTRILHFSNPNITYGGNPTGLATTSPSSAYNALSLDNTRVTVANWRQASRPSISLVSPNGGESWQAGSLRTISWTGTELPAGAVVVVSYSSGTVRGFRTNRTAEAAIASVPASQGSYAWRVPSTFGDSWRVTVCVAAPASPARGTPGGRSCLASDTSEAPFSIVR
jgi:hypothetical protein